MPSILCLSWKKRRRRKMMIPGTPKSQIATSSNCSFFSFSLPPDHHVKRKTIPRRLWSWPAASLVLMMVMIMMMAKRAKKGQNGQKTAQEVKRSQRKIEWQRRKRYAGMIRQMSERLCDIIQMQKEWIVILFTLSRPSNNNLGEIKGHAVLQSPRKGLWK